jgi:hypothetical protein
MGGLGSGRSAGLGLSADKCHEFHAVDLAWLKRRKLLVPGRWSTLTWSRGGTPTGSIRIAPLPSGLMLSYRHRPSDGAWQDVNETVPLVETHPKCGGVRLWFECLSCRRRCRIIYGGARFRCRRCHHLKYDTQYEQAFARAATRALKIRERLGCKGGIDEPFPDKPKGMHWKTYRRLEAQDERLQARWAAGLWARWRAVGDGTDSC